MKIVFITGAGISTASGLPTYRGENGLYGDDPVEDGGARVARPSEYDDDCSFGYGF